MWPGYQYGEVNTFVQTKLSALSTSSNSQRHLVYTRSHYKIECYFNWKATTHIHIANASTYYSFIDPKRMNGWVGHVGWHTADGLHWGSHILQSKQLTGDLLIVFRVINPLTKEFCNYFPIISMKTPIHLFLQHKLPAKKLRFGGIVSLSKS